jgi:hypothetical protein
MAKSNNNFDSLSRLLRAESTMHAHVRLPICAVLRLQPFPWLTDVFNLCFRPVTLVELAGFVVRRTLRRDRVEWTLDDGTGLLACTHWHAATADAADTAVHVGTFVRLHGRLKLFRGQHNVTVYRVAVDEHADAQALVWLQQAHASLALYSVVDETLRQRVLQLCSRLS